MCTLNTSQKEIEGEKVYRPSNCFPLNLVGTTIARIEINANGKLGMFYRKSGVFLVAALLLVACTHHTQSADVSKTTFSGGSQGSIQQSITRVIIYFQRPTSESKQISSAISVACRCVPVFFGSYGSDALIYELALSEGRTFAIFENELKRKADSLEIKSIEQDSILQHQ